MACFPAFARGLRHPIERSFCYTTPIATLLQEPVVFSLQENYGRRG